MRTRIRSMAAAKISRARMSHEKRWATSPARAAAPELRTRTRIPDTIRAAASAEPA